MTPEQFRRLEALYDAAAALADSIERLRFIDEHCADDEEVLKNRRAYGMSAAPAASASVQRPLHQHFGSVIVSCEHADLRPTAEGVTIYANEKRWLDALPAPEIPRAEVIDELVGAVLHGRSPLHSGEWGLATMEVCLAILQSAQERKEIALTHQVGVPFGQ